MVRFQGDFKPYWSAPLTRGKSRVGEEDEAVRPSRQHHSPFLPAVVRKKPRWQHLPAGGDPSRANRTLLSILCTSDHINMQKPSIKCWLTDTVSVQNGAVACCPAGEPQLPVRLQQGTACPLSGHNAWSLRFIATREEVPALNMWWEKSPWQLNWML